MPHSRLTVADLKRLLIDDLAISPATWDRVEAAATDADDVSALLRQCQVTVVSPEDGAPSGAMVLTDHQASEIAKLRGPGLRLRDWIIRSRLGEGGFGAVFLAFNLSQRRLDALKLLRSDQLGRREVRTRFRRESNQVSHWGIPKIHEGFLNEDVPFFVMEYIPGENLETRIKSKSAAVDEAVAWLSTAATILRSLHEQGCVHRDVKPANLIVREDTGELRLVDLGIARFENDTQMTFGGGMGSPPYMAPEAWDHTHYVSEPSDIYGLGCAFYYVLTGQLPFDCADNLLPDAHRNAARPRVTEHRPDVPPWLDALIFWMMQPEVADRCHSADDVLDWIERHTAPKSSPPGIPRTSALSRLGRPLRIVHDRDESEMALVQAGRYWVGQKDGSGADHAPAHRVLLSDYYLDIHLVTNGRFFRFAADCEAGCFNYTIKGPWKQHYQPGVGDELPVRDVTFEDARAYCTWAGKALPLEVQWEVAARSGGTPTYPWAEGLDQRRWGDYARAASSSAGHCGPCYVGGCLPNLGGFHDMTGNLAQWVADYYFADAYAKRDAGECDPHRDKNGTERVVRGQAWDCPADQLQLFKRDRQKPEFHSPWIGFRTAWRPEIMVRDKAVAFDVADAQPDNSAAVQIDSNAIAYDSSGPKLRGGKTSGLSSMRDNAESPTRTWLPRPRG